MKIDFDKPIGKTWLTLLDVFVMLVLFFMMFSTDRYVHVMSVLLGMLLLYTGAMTRHFLELFKKSATDASDGWATSNRMWKEDIAAHKAVIDSLLAERRN